MTFYWHHKRQQAFDKIKEILCSKPVLASSKTDESFIITVDAFDYSSIRLNKLDQDKLGQERLCVYASWPVKDSKLCYQMYDKKLLALVFVKKKFWLSGTMSL